MRCLNESPSQKEGKSGAVTDVRVTNVGLNESPSKKEGKCHRESCTRGSGRLNESPSEKEGKSAAAPARFSSSSGLNESPSEKEGKSGVIVRAGDLAAAASMKALPKRKGNLSTAPRLMKSSPPQ